MRERRQYFELIIILLMFVVNSCRVQQKRESSLKDNITLSPIDSFVLKHFGNLDTNLLKMKYSDVSISAMGEDSVCIYRNGIKTIYKDSFFIRIDPSINGRRYKYFDYSGRIFKIEYYFPSGWLDKRYIVRDGYYWRDASVPMGHEF